MLNSTTVDCILRLRNKIEYSRKGTEDYRNLEYLKRCLFTDSDEVAETFKLLMDL